MIDKNTILYGSFSQTPGNFGVQVHNMAYQLLGINAIYKPFQIDNIDGAIEAMKTLKMGGASVSMPYKVTCIDYLDFVDEHVRNIGACNTIVNKSGILMGYNTDYLALKHVIKRLNNKIVILGNGGYAKAAFYACQLLNKPYINITRANWKELDNLKDHAWLNCTPLVLEGAINASVTDSGRYLALIQAVYQFKLYIGQNFPLKYIFSHFFTKTPNQLLINI